MRSRGTILVLVVWLLALVSLPSSARSPKVKVLEVSRYARVALLVCRMSDEKGLPVEILPETDYARRALAPKTAVYLDDETRVKAAFPSYPLRFTLGMPKMEVHFYGNLTAPVTEAVTALLKEKGHEVVDVRGESANWPKPIAESTVKEVMQGLAGKADALLVVHYVDSGYSLYDSVKVRRVDKGLAGLALSLALFDVASGQRLGQVEAGVNPMALFANDPAVLKDPALKAKIETVESVPKEYVPERGFCLGERTGFFYRGGTATLLHLTDEELVQIALRYLRDGFKDPKHMFDLDGLNALLQ